MQKFIINILLGLAVKLIEKYKPEVLKKADEKYDDLKEELKDLLNGKINEMIGASVVAVTTAAGKSFNEATDIIENIIPGEKDNEFFDFLNGQITNIIKGFQGRQ